MSIQAVKGVEIGDGFALARLRGSQAHDEIVRDNRGITGKRTAQAASRAGVSNGQEIVVRAAMKPLPTLMRPLRTVDLTTGQADEALVERSDVAAVEALAVVAEAVVAFELARTVREKFGGDALGDLLAAHASVPGADGVPIDRGRPGALDRHVALVGFMGAGKSELAGQVAARLDRPLVDVDANVERVEGVSIAELFAATARARSGGSRRQRRSRRWEASGRPCWRSAAGRSALSGRVRRCVIAR